MWVKNTGDLKDPIGKRKNKPKPVVPKTLLVPIAMSAPSKTDGTDRKIQPYDDEKARGRDRKAVSLEAPSSGAIPFGNHNQPL